VQYDSVPDLERRYIQEERRVRGQPPYMNGWEWPAYVVEARVFREALAAGYPAGPHVPLLVLDGLA
ncbi:MAG: hypothetical protein Q8P59_04955, partial [Dehalococcoidia bacterium]|nr:hypothetical protein [Dehalococcoidia bacterium]